MNDSTNTIADGTIVTHRSYPGRTYGYELNPTSLPGDPVYTIKRDGAAVASGGVTELNHSGFLFNAPDGTVEEIEALLTPEEPAPSAIRQAWLASEEANRILAEEVQNLNGIISDLRGEAAERERTFTSLRQRATVSERNLDTFKEQVVEAVKEARKEHDLCIDGCNTFLGGLDLPKISKSWTGKVTRDSDGEVLLTVTGIEGDDEYEARNELESNFTVTATITAITFDYEYGGEGDADWDHESHSDDDWDECDDEQASDHKDGLSFSVEEE